MATIVQDLERATDAINDIESKLIQKGVISSGEEVAIENYPDRIDRISGGSATLQSKYITSNGTYTPDTSYDGFSEVTVYVEGGGESMPSYYNVPEYSSDSEYTKGSYVLHNGDLWKAQYYIDHEEWDADNFKLITSLVEELSTLDEFKQVVAISTTTIDTSNEKITHNNTFKNCGHYDNQRQRTLVVEISKLIDGDKKVLHQLFIDLSGAQNSSYPQDPIDAILPVDTIIPIATSSFNIVYACVKVTTTSYNTYNAGFSLEITFKDNTGASAWSTIFNDANVECKVKQIGSLTLSQ